MKIRFGLFWVGVLLVPFLAGCGGSTEAKLFAGAADTNAKRLGTLYRQYQTQNTRDRLLGPASQQEFEEFIKRQSKTGLARIGINKEDFSSLFISSRDKQPFKIRWAVQGISRGPAQPVVFEAEGVDGKFVVGFTGFIEQEVDKVEYDRLWSGAADQGT